MTILRKGLISLLILLNLGHVPLINAQDDAAAPPADAAAAPPPQAGGGNSSASGKAEYQSPAPWVRVCASGKYIGAVSPSKDDCLGGYWFKETTKVGCVCGHGVWVFAKGWCDTEAKVIVAYNGSCFNINKDVRYVRQLGWNNNAFMPYHFVGTSGLEYIQDVPEVTAMPGRSTFFHKQYHQHIGAVFRERAVESMTGRFCLSPEGNKTRTFAMKYFIPKMPYMQKRVCFAYPGQEQDRFEYDAGYELGQGFTLSAFVTFEKPPTSGFSADTKKCVSECVAPKPFTPNSPKNQSLLPDYLDPNYDDYLLEELKEISWTNTTTLPEELPNQNCTRTYTLTNKTLAEIQEQTNRMARYVLQSALNNEMTPSIKFKDYKLMQKARTIFDKVCPEAELPSTVLTGMLKMFRIALNESFFHYAFHQLGDDQETVKLLEILGQCETDAKPMEFNYKKDNNSNDACTLGKFIGVDYNFKELNRTILTRMPCHLQANITDLDLAVETAWKTVMFTHYYCARHFGNHSVGFSIFEQKMERFFNRWMQHRWFYPGTSLKAYTYVFQMFNITRFALAMDRCVAAARAFSVYRKWIQRPVYLKYLTGKLFEEQYDIPDRIAGRTSLDAINPKLNKFGKKAFCLPYWHAPASNPGLDYNPDGDFKPGCVKYKKDEWQTPFKPAVGKSDGWRNTIDMY